ncbi:similar to Saccharomyces cerevisiae YDR221W GTB1 Glucosidase II beta subunit, forms a complex with alpha subunit Rot2p [Geotrichum candidum]|uniref:Glucosidase 2 subunit beta n=1 Tax=Geotrichum candidum TaxID=1173061 RepID=A0A0J9X544_GEOCN|nr:similar to Saccharomyces cerevisiae YDR221W GTB1 Glucosidase II beta subunit, forms a complex with alpha subunit Rot2p [Geotrichum candidum]
MKLSNVALLALLGHSSAKVLGVAPEDQAKYQPDANNNWACLNHPDIVISFDQINDDICDCPDNSDEPGTAACPGNSFYCENKGHIPGRLPSSRVNDGVCDYEVCCDGSDEWLLSEKGLVPKCENKCKEINAKYVKEQKRLKSIKEAGLKIKNHLVEKAKKLTTQLGQELQKNEEQLKAIEIKVAEDEKKLAALLASSSTGIEEAIPEEIAKIQNDLKELEVKYSAAFDAINKYVANIAIYKQLLETMKAEYNPNFNDPAVKAAIRSFEEITANEGETIDEKSRTQLASGKLKFSDVISNLGEYRPQSTPQSTGTLSSYIDSKLRLAKLWLIDNGLLADSSFDSYQSSSSVDNAEVTLLQNIVNKKKTELNKLKTDINQLRSDLASSNYGRHDILRSLKDTCISNNLGEYTYEFCFNGQASQRDRNGQSTNLGKFDNIKYPDNSDSVILNFEHGAKCWSGPIRRASVELVCDDHDEILLVSEPERCEYFFKVSSPIACAEDKIVDDEVVRDEL